MAGKRILAVIGATGAQGGGLARAALDDATGDFAVRAITRRPDAAPAQALAARGAEIVTADLDDVDSLARAFAGADAAFCVTNFWEHFSPERERRQARHLAEAAARAGVRHAVWSTFEDTRRRVPLDDDRMPTLQGRYKVPHFDAKAEADDDFRALGVPTTFLLTSFYWDNLIHFGMGPTRGEDGVLRFVLPMGDHKLPGIAVEDIGRSVYGIVRAGDAMIGRTVGVAGAHLSGAEMARALGDALGEEVRHEAPPPAVFRSFGFPGADDLGNMFQYKAEFEAEYRAARSVEATRALNPALLDFEGWLAANAARIAVPPPAAVGG